MTSLLEFCLPDYERENISEYIDKDKSRLIITNQNLTQFQKLKEKLGLKESFGQKQQFDQQIEELEKQEQKLNQDIQKYKKQSGKGLFSSKTPEEKIQEKQQQLELVKQFFYIRKNYLIQNKNNANLQKVEEEKENLIKYQNILMAIFIFVYKKSFIKHKIVTYKKLFNLIGKTEINKSEIQKLFWSQFGNYALEVKQHDHQLKI
ncbi:hypothetical protein PPERSA_10292 [Pseudocohnilembus persalinus]|uniref:Uncharacterized protein n=1 Tax=Pseudocohnilembus persalinus TaxID=266149 RepID=A0A0V0R0T7_PSEPJ|nr:hypothetical protein PPERSA_10292 [Pseudocohnilembus persalinus]|eukprot:KRX07904.1 hypothetical protein PPERSA_10292 [Pseudocohnilembus persalinus]